MARPCGGQVRERQAVRGVGGKLRSSRAELTWHRLHVLAPHQRSQPVACSSQATMAWKRSSSPQSRISGVPLKGRQRSAARQSAPIQTLALAATPACRAFPKRRSSLKQNIPQSFQRPTLIARHLVCIGPIEGGCAPGPPETEALEMPSRRSPPTTTGPARPRPPASHSPRRSHRLATGGAGRLGAAPIQIRSDIPTDEAGLGSGQLVRHMNSRRSCRDRRLGSVTQMNEASGLDEPKETQ
jgi:hypothetical protein